MRRFFVYCLIGSFLFASSACESKAPSANKPVVADQQIPEEYIYTINESLAFIDKLLDNAQYATQSDIDKGTDLAGLPRTDSGTMKETFAVADSVWGAFRSLCSKGRYKEAWELYYQNNNQQHFFVALKTTTSQYEFHKNVLATLDKAYDFDNSMSKTADNLCLVLMMTDVVFSLHYNENGYVPPHYEELFYTCLVLYKRLGNESKVREIVDEYAQNISLIEGKSEKEMLKEIGEFLEKIE